MRTTTASVVVVVMFIVVVFLVLEAASRRVPEGRTPRLKWGYSRRDSGAR